MLKKLILMTVCFVLCSVAFGEFQQIDFPNVSNDNTLEIILRERLSRTGDTFSYRNGLTTDNATNNAFTWTENSEDLIWTFGTNKIALSSSTSLAEVDFASIFIEMAEISKPSNPGSDTGRIYVRDVGTVTTLFFLDSGGNESSLIAAAAGNSLDGAYNAGSTIDVDANPVTMTTSNTDDNRVLDIVQNDTTNNPETMRITNTGSGDTLQFVSTGGKDIDGSGSTWSVTSAGALIAVSGTIPTMTVATSLTAGSGIILDSGDTLRNSTDTEFLFTDTGGENFSIDMDAASNAIGLKSGSGVDELQLGDIDDLTGVGTIVFDAEDSSISLAADGTDDLTIAVTGAQDARLLIQSEGTQEDAIAISTSAGGMTITVAGAAGAEDLTLLSNTAVNITSSQAADLAINIATSNSAGQIQITSADTTDDAIEVDSSGGIDIDAVDVINIDNSGSGKDIRIDSAAGRLELVGGEAAATAVVIDAENAAGGIDVDFGTGAMTLTGTGTAANLTIDIDALSFDFTDSSNITVTSSEGGEDLTISQLGSNDSSVIISSEGQGANAIELTTTDALGDIDINAGDAITIDAGDIVITTDDTVASQFHVNATGTVSGDAIILETSSGAIKLLSDGSGTGDITLDAEGLISIVTAEAATDQFKVDAQGTGAGFVINLKTTNGGIILNADDGTNGDITLDAASVLNLIAAGGITTSDSFTGDGTAALGGFLKTVTNDAEPHAILVTESGTVLTNLGSDGADAWTLPTAATGLEYIFVVMAAQDMQISPASGDVINKSGTVNVANPDNYSANAVGEMLHIIAVDNTNWIVVAEEGTWTDSNP